MSLGLVEEPFNKRERRIYRCNIIITIILALLPLVYYPELPQTVPSHWNAHGEITSYSSKAFLTALLSILMPMANAIIVSVARYRWTLLNKHPYLVNLPAITMLLASPYIENKEKSLLLNKVFEAILWTGCMLGLYMLGIEIMILEAALSKTNYGDLMTIYMLAGFAALIPTSLVIYRNIYKTITQKIHEAKGRANWILNT